jgi:hypothetical protein
MAGCDRVGLNRDPGHGFAPPLGEHVVEQHAIDPSQR